MNAVPPAVPILTPVSAFNRYWNALGLPLSRFKGAITDSVPFSLVEASLWWGTLATLVWIFLWARRKRGGAKIPRRIAFFLGPVFLIALGLGQGAFPLSLAPTAWRASLAGGAGTDSVEEGEFKTWTAQREARLRGEFDWRAYQSLPETEVLKACDASLDTVLADLGLPPGRKVRRLKPMGPVTTSLGLVYGGPAFHDPFFGEIAVVRYRDLPTPRHWRLIAVCHEAAHAKGFTREIDAEILTQLALLRISDSRFRMLADIHFLQKTGLKPQWPESLIAESRRERKARLERERHQPVVSFLRDWAERLRLRNSGRKYGDRERGEAWNPRQPFFAAVRRLQSKIPEAR